MKIVQGVDYRHFILTAYVKVWGPSREEAATSANELREALSQELPDAEVYPPRYKGEPEGHGHIFWVPAVIAKCPEKAKSLIARRVLSGHL